MLFLDTGQFSMAFLGPHPEWLLLADGFLEAAFFCALFYQSRIRVCAPWLLKPFESDRRKELRDDRLTRAERIPLPRWAHLLKPSPPVRAEWLAGRVPTQTSWLSLSSLYGFRSTQILAQSQPYYMWGRPLMWDTMWGPPTVLLSVVNMSGLIIYTRIMVIYKILGSFFSLFFSKL